MYKTLGFRWLCEVFCPASAFATADREEARNPQRFIHVSVVQHIRETYYKINYNMKTSFAKSIIIFCVFYFSTLKTFSQDTLTYIQTQNIENELGLKNNQEFKVYIMKENYALNIGDTLIIGDPANLNKCEYECWFNSH
jgi:hypothetical protein